MVSSLVFPFFSGLINSSSNSRDDSSELRPLAYSIGLSPPISFAMSLDKSNNHNDNTDDDNNNNKHINNNNNDNNDDTTIG